MTKYVIIGNSTAAAGCIEGIRSVDEKGEITVISGENHFVYSRPLISYYLEEKTDLQRMKYRPDDFYEKNNCKVLYGVMATKIDKENKKVYLDNGEEISFDKLMIATGSSPFVPPFKGLDTVENKFSFMTIDDALAIEKKINKDSKVLIVGAGLIGLKCAEGLLEKVKKITVCDLADRVLSSIFDNECAKIMQAHLEEKGIEFLLGDSAEEFLGNTAKMMSGKTVEYDVLILAVGVRANILMAKEIDIKTNRGILVDTKMQTSVKNIYAAGDCTEYLDYSSNTQKVMAILPNAYLQGLNAGKNMAGEQCDFDNAIPMNSIGFFGLHAMSAGSYYDEKDGGKCYIEKGEKHIKKLFVKDGVLTGFIIIGDVSKAGIYTNLIRNKTQLSEIDFEMIKESPTLFAFSKENRGKMLGGVV